MTEKKQKNHNKYFHWLNNQENKLINESRRDAIGLNWNKYE